MCLFRNIARLLNCSNVSWWQPTLMRATVMLMAMILATVVTMILTSYEIVPDQQTYQPKYYSQCKGTGGIKLKRVPVPPSDIITTPSGLQYLDIIEGTGESPKTGEILSVNYKGFYPYDGDLVEFDRSYFQPFNFTFGVGMTINGWDEGLATMKVGGKRKLIIPPDMVYVKSGVGSIPANSPLIYEVELIGIQHRQARTK